MDYTKDGVLIEDIINHQMEEVANQSLPLEEESHLVPNQSLSTLEEYADYNYNDTLDVIPYSMRPETYIVPILFAIIFIIGVMGNGTLIAIFIRHRTMRNVPNMYIVSLACGDLFVILFCVPFTSTVYTVDSWPYGEFVCKFSEFIKDLSIGVSVFTLTALSADRYFAIVDPMRKHHGRKATRITCITIAGIWVLSVALALPSAIFAYVRAIDEHPPRIFYVCYPFPPELGKIYSQVMVMSHFLIYYAIPLSFISTFYISMARHLVLSTRNMPGEGQPAQGQAKQIQARKKVAKMILSFVVIFALCFLPSHIFLLWFYFNPQSEYEFNDFWHVCRITGFCLSFINSCINPITLYCVSGTFRKQFNEHLFCCFCEPDGRNRPRRRAGFGCGCVSLSSAGPVFGDFRLRNGGYAAGRGLCRGSTTNSANGCNSTMKRKSTFDTQSTMSHPMYHNYNLTVSPMPNYGGNYSNAVGQHNCATTTFNGDTPTTNSTAINTPDSLAKHSTVAANNSVNGSSLNNTFPLTHHPYQKDYHEYLSRINALEKGDPPPKLLSGNYTKTKLAKTKLAEASWSGNKDKGVDEPKKERKCLRRDSTKSGDNEYTVTSFINLGGSGGSTTTRNENGTSPESPEQEIPLLITREKVEIKGENQ